MNTIFSHLRVAGWVRRVIIKVICHIDQNTLSKNNYSFWTSINPTACVIYRWNIYARVLCVLFCANSISNVLVGYSVVSACVLKKTRSYLLCSLLLRYTIVSADGQSIVPYKHCTIGYTRTGQHNNNKYQHLLP